jgi:hypothetical protein
MRSKYSWWGEYANHGTWRNKMQKKNVFDDFIAAAEF